ncbi:MAG: SpoIIE family protein phosphatase [Bacteroidales bacterium]|nr:SpoIIE family protein phosphatase [Bacteroidales bacterium]MCF8386862.1 SpoIIE family protein phosphatase [Bacteroidales bacterium]MCF8396549.1 SpoIIE family protein phosphatase [Bacteroidales bacterium]
MKNKGLGFKLALYIVTATVVIVGVILWINYYNSKKVLVKNMEEQADDLARATVNKIEGELETVSKIPENEAKVFENFNISKEQLNRYIQMIVTENPEIFGSCVAFEPYQYFPDSLYYAPYCYRKDDSIVCENLGNDSYQYFYWDWYQIPAVLNKPVWSEPYFDEGGGNILMCTYSVPFYRKNSNQKELHGIVTVDISLEWLDKLVSSIKLFETGYAYLISSNGSIVTHPNDKFEMHQTIFSIAEEYDKPHLREVGREMLAGKSGFTEYSSVYTNKDGYMYYYPLSVTGWSLGVIFPKDELFADLYKLNRSLLLIGIIGIVALLTLIIIISKRITKPLSRLARITQDIGGGDFEVNLPATVSNDEIGQLTRSIDHMQVELKQYMQSLKATTAAKERIESELKIAHDIQQGIIPKIFPPFPEREDVDLYAILDPARDVGGDLYDFFFIDDYKLCFAIGDVSGKGVPASLFMAITRTLLRAKATKGAKVENIVKSMNMELCQGNENSMFVTFFIGIIDLQSGVVEYCNAGHNYPYLLRSDCRMEILEKTHGTPLGIFEDIDYQSDSIRLEKRDNLVLYTDGVPEAMDIDDKAYGDERLKELLKKHCRKSPDQITNEMLYDVKHYVADAQQSDDITILSLTYFLKK